MKPIQLQTQITSISARPGDGSLRLSMVTPTLGFEEKVLIMELQNINLTTTLQPLDEPETEPVEINTDIETKTPSKRLRGSLYVLLSKKLKRKPEGNEWISFYQLQMEKIIESVKLKIEEYE